MTRPVIMLTGAGGQLGYELAALLAAHGEVVATDVGTLDLTDPDAIVAAVRSLRPTLIVNAAAYTAVDLAEKERDLAYAINARAPGVLADEARKLDAMLIHYSTDYVFDGASSLPYVEDAPKGPLGVYGASKLAGEEAVAASGALALTFRTSWVYGLRGRNFLLTMRRLAAERDELTVVADQTGTPNWCRELAQATVRVVATGRAAMAERAGLYHLSATGSTTWFEFARAIIGDVERPRIVPIATAGYPTPARRPAFGVLDTRKFERSFGFALSPWRDTLRRCVESPVEPSPFGDNASLR